MKNILYVILISSISFLFCAESDKALNEEDNQQEKENSFLEDPKQRDIDITGIVFSDPKGTSMQIEYQCHKEECLDFKYNSSSTYNSYKNESPEKVILTIEPIVLNKWAMMYDSNEDIAGFQFDVIGATLLTANGGEAEKNGFNTSFGKSNAVESYSFTKATILSFSFTGETIKKGKGTLVVFEVE